MKNLFLLLVPFVLFQINLSAQIRTEQSNKPLFFKVTSHDQNIRELPAKSFYESKTDWQYIIDTTWGPGLPLSQKQQIFNTLATKLDDEFDGFESLGFTPATWDTFKTFYYNKIDSSTSRGRFSAIMSYFTLALKDRHTYAYDDVVLNTPLNPSVPLLMLSGWVNADHFGAVVTCLPDSSVLILRVVDNHPLNLEPGDIIIGYEGDKWKDILEELFDAELPILPWVGGCESSIRDELLLSAGMNWHLFSTIDILKQSTGDTVHLSLTPMLSLNSPPILNNEQIEISNIAFPNYWNGEIVTYGILENTNIGYVYVFSEWPTTPAEQQFNQAISALQNTDGIIVDMRWNVGGWALWYDAFGILTNEITYTLNDVLRCSPSDWTLCPTGDSISYKLTGQAPKQYERPIAILLGPTCLSMGDINTNRLNYLSTSRIFGKSSAASYGWNDVITSFPDWSIKYSKGDMYHLRQPGIYLNRKELPIDYPVWFNPVDAANGYDTVVEEARGWINNLAYGHDVLTNSIYASPGIDTVIISAIIENPNSNNVLTQIFVKDLNNALIDSLEMSEVEFGELWQGKWLSASYEDYFKFDIKTSDQTMGETFTIQNVNQISTAGPISVENLEITYLPGQNYYQVKPHIKNEGQTLTIDNIFISMSSEDTCITSVVGNLFVSSIAPGQTIIHPGHFTVVIDSNFYGWITFNFEINRNGWLYWQDSYDIGIAVGDTIYVPADYSTIQEAIDAAMDGNTILVADGIYYENINYKGKAITVSSHFLVDSLESHIENTIIDGSQPSNPDSASVVTFDSGEDTTSVLCGFTITGGTGTYSSHWDDRNGGGIYLDSSGAKIKNNIIKDNSIVFSGYAYGAGIMAFCFGNHNVIISNNLIESNYLQGSDTFGAGIALWSNSYSLVFNNIITNNTHNSDYCQGGGIHMGPGNHKIINNYIFNNSALSQLSSGGGAGGIYLISSANMNDAPLIANNLIFHNEGTEGGGIKVWTLTESSNERGSGNKEKEISTIEKITYNPIIENNSILFNTSPGLGGGIRNGNNTPTQIINNIVWGNDGYLTYDQIYGTAQTVTYCNVQGGFGGEGNIDEDPMFDDTTYYCINQNSPCVDAGDPDPIYNDVEDPNNPGFALLPARGTLMNDMGCFGGPNSQWSMWDILVSVKGDETKTGIPIEFALSQNYPNPFNPTTTIKYAIKERTFVELKVYDILGRQVATLINEEQDAGYYELNFNASKLSSGVYLYQLKAGEFIETRKMLLIK